MLHDLSIAHMLLDLAHDFERYAEKYGEPRRSDDLLADRVRYLEDVVAKTEPPNDDTPREVSQARGRDERH